MVLLNVSLQKVRKSATPFSTCKKMYKILVAIKAERSHFLQLTFPDPKIFEKVLKKLVLYKGTLGGYSK